MQQVPLDELCTPPMVATILGVSTPTVYAAIRRDDQGLAHLRTPGGQIRVRRRDVLAYCHQTGMVVPAGLLPVRPKVVVIHPVQRRVKRLQSQLGSRYKLHLFRDPLEGLSRIGALKPPLVLISQRVGAELINRLEDAIREDPAVGYITVVTMAPNAKNLPTEGSLPDPLVIPEPTGDGYCQVVPAVERLLGLV